jgi:sugar/nucleoside kinase (ribokinase family)
MHRIAILGGTTFDHIVHLNELPKPIPHTIHVAPFHEATGSTGAGKALSLAKLGMPIKLYSVLGNDSYGMAIVEHLRQENIDFTFDFDPSGTERHFNIMDSEGGRISMFVTQSSENPPISLQAVSSIVDWADVIVINIISYCKHLTEMVASTGKPVWTDLHDYDGVSSYHEPFIKASRFIHLSSDNLPDYRPTMQRFIDEGKELVVCTHGKQGATALTSSYEWFEQDAIFEYPLVDSNGAGDCFFSAFLAGYLKDYSIRKCLRMGAIAGALATSSLQLTSENLSALLLENEYDRLFTKE